MARSGILRRSGNPTLELQTSGIKSLEYKGQGSNLKIEDKKVLAEHVYQPQQLESGITTRRYQANTANFLLRPVGLSSYTQEDARRVLRKIDLFVCLAMCFTYFIQQVRALFPVVLREFPTDERPTS